MDVQDSEEVLSDEPPQNRPKHVSQDLHVELCRLAELVDLGTFLSGNSQEDDYVVVVEEAVHRLRRLLAEPASAQETAQARSNRISKQDQKIMEKSKQFEDDLLKSLEQVEKRDEWYSKYKRLSAKLQKEKAQQGVLEEFIQSQNKKIAVLVDHVDKLMKAIKLENVKRMKLVEETRKTQKEEAGLRSKLDRQARMIASQQRAVREVSEGSKVLEDQLRLMDEKYLELRTKLDITRDHLGKKIRAAKKECSELRTKYAFAMNGASLDKVKVDEGFFYSTTAPGLPDPATDRIASPPALESVFRDVEAVRGARANRSRSVDFSPPVAMQTAAYNTVVAKPAPATAKQQQMQQQMHQHFMQSIKIGLPPQSLASPAVTTPQAMGQSGSNAASPKHRSSSPSSNADSRGRPTSASSPPRSQATPTAASAAAAAATSQRPRTALHLSASTGGLHGHKSLDDRILTHVVRKIERKQGPQKRGGWTADRIIELLGT